MFIINKFNIYYIKILIYFCSIYRIAWRDARLDTMVHQQLLQEYYKEENFTKAYQRNIISYFTPIFVE